MKNVVIIGTSDMAKHMTSYLLNDNYRLVGYFDDYLKVNTKILDNIILGKVPDIINFKDKFDSAFIGIGYNFLKEKSKITELLIDNNIKLGTYVHNSTYLDKSSKVENGAFILPNCTIDKEVHIGRNVFMNQNCSVSHDSSVGSETFFGPGVIISGKTNIGNRCFIGTGSIIIDNIEICDDVIVGAGTVVIKDIYEPGLYVGNPARKIK
jgi:sugar O-acyltransferase (sialic acid O-acetyltransferase NeuD family)